MAEELTPTKIVEELDKYIVGQKNAKKAVAEMKDGSRFCYGENLQLYDKVIETVWGGPPGRICGRRQ